MNNSTHGALFQIGTHSTEGLIRIDNVDVSMNGTNYQRIISGVGQGTVGILTVLTEMTIKDYVHDK